MDSEAINELDLIEGKLNELLPRLGKHRIEELQRLIARHFVKRFAGRRKLCKYGHLNKGFTTEQVKAFFGVIDSAKLRLLFGLQASLALRIGEACRVSIKDLNLETRELLIRTEKAQTLDTLIIPLALFNELLDYVRTNAKDIEQANGYLFYPDSSKTARKGTFIEQNYVRNRFREYVAKAGLDEVYGASDESKGRAVRRLHRLTSHSLRHFSITAFSRQTNGNLILTSKFARHLAPSTTMTYINTDKTELYSVIERNSILLEAIALKERVK